MTIVIPFKTLSESFPDLVSGAGLAYGLHDQMKKLIRLMLAPVRVDETWYCGKYPDVAQAITNGVFTSATRHFVDHGYFEGRQPGWMDVDENWYLRAYPDVADLVDGGEIASAAEHFNLHGYHEGRLPVPLPD